MKCFLPQIIYIVLFALTSLFAWAMGEYAGDVLKWVPSFSICKDNACMGANAVYRVTFALSIFHFLSAAFTIGVKNSDDSRAEFQNSII
jgi:serine incorporator 1/3